MGNPRLIAEISSNYMTPSGKSMDRAKTLIRKAADSGADYVKFQLFRPEKLVNKAVIPQVFEILTRTALTADEVRMLADYANRQEVGFLCSVFDQDSLEVVDPLVGMHKIASWELPVRDHTYPLLRSIAQKGKPVLMSTGAHGFDEIDTILCEMYDEDEDIQAILLHSDPCYPMRDEDVDLQRIVDLWAEFPHQGLGYSSHCTNEVLVAASVLYGVEYIEVHFDDEDKVGAEANHSYTPTKFRQLKRLCEKFAAAKTPTPQALIDANRDLYLRHPSDNLRPLKR